MADVLYSADGEIFQYDSVEDLMTTEDMDEYYVGYELYEAETYEFGTDWVNADYIIERIDELWYDVGGEGYSDFKPSEEAKQELEAFLQQWQEKHAVAPFVGVKNVLPYYITQEDLDRVSRYDET